MGVIASVQQYDLNIPVGGSQAIDVAGDRVQFLSAADPFAVIEVRPNFAQGNITLSQGQGMRFSEQVQRWVVFNKGSLALTGMLMIGTGDFFDHRISGTVAVIDGGKARTLGAAAFSIVAGVAAAAGQYGRLQLWNAAGSGKRLIVESVTQTTGSGGGTGLTTTIYNAPITNAIGYGICKRSGQPDSTAGQFRTDTTLTAPPAFGLIGSSLPVSSTYQQKPVEPIILEPGYGLLMWAGNVNTTVGASVEWYEEGI